MNMPDISSQPQISQYSQSDSQNIAQEIYKRNRELLKERRHAEKFLYNVSEGVFAVDKEFRISIFNNALEDMLGIPSDIALGKPFDELIKIETHHGEQVDLRPYCFVYSQNQPIVYDLQLKGFHKTFFVNAKFSLIEDENNKEQDECLITLTDVTNEVLLDRAKDDFLSLASHEMKTPLTIIKGYLWMLQSNMAGPLNEEQAHYVDIAAQSTERMISMTNDMLNISRMEQGKLTFNFSTGKIFEAVKKIKETYDLIVKEQNIYLNVELVDCDENIEAYYDSDKLEECLINLIGNAIKFTKEGGVTVKVINESEKIRISIIDTGVGISKDEESKLFSKFGKIESSYTKVDKVGGTGLGLYIVKMFIEAMGGEIGYKSNGDFMGSEFWFTVPKGMQIY